MADDATMEVPLSQRNHQRNVNLLATQGVVSTAREEAAGDRMMMDEDEGGRDEREGSDHRESPEPWYMRAFWTMGRTSTSSPGNVAASWSGDDCREEDMDMGREDYYDERIHEPLKRQQEEDGGGQGQGQQPAVCGC